jgi:hypothetical protein
MSVPESSHDAPAEHEHRDDFPLSNVQFLADYQQIQLVLLGPIEEEGVGAFEEGPEGGSEGEQEDGRLADQVGGLDQFLHHWRHPQDELLEEGV